MRTSQYYTIAISMYHKKLKKLNEHFWMV